MKTAYKWVLGILAFLLLGLFLTCLTIYLFFTSAKGRTILANRGFFYPPSSKRTQKQESVFFFNFETKSDDNLQWGAYCTRLLYYKIKFAPDEILYLPSLDQLFMDLDRNRIANTRTFPLPYSAESFLAKAYGIEHILHGTVSKQGDQIRFDGVLYKENTDTPVATIQETGSIQDPAEFIKKIGLSIFRVLNVPLTQQEQKVLQEPIVSNPQAFFTALNAFSQPDEQSQKSVGLYKQAIALDTNFIYAYDAAFSRLSFLNSSESGIFLQNALRLHPKNPFLRLENEKKPKDLNYMQILMDYPDNQDALYGLAGYFYNYQEELQVMKYMSKKYPNCWYVPNDIGYIYLNYAIRIRGNRPFSQLNTQTQKNYTWLVEEANENLQKAQELFPNNPIVLSNLMGIGIETNQSEETILNYFTRATAINPHIKQDWYTLATLYRPEHLDQPEKLYNVYSHALKENPYDLDIAKDMMYRINWYAIQHRNPKMVTVYRKDTTTLALADAVLYPYVIANPQDDYTRYMAAEGFYYVMDSVHSWKYYEEIKSEPPPSANVTHEYYLHKGQIASLMNQPDTALHYLDLCFQNNPCEICGPNACIIKAGILLERKNMDEGFGMLEKAIQWNPKKIRSYWAYAYYSAEYKIHLDQGFRYIQKAIEMEPDNANYWATLANIYYLQKNKIKAQEAITKALQLDSSQSWIQAIKKKISKMS